LEHFKSELGQSIGTPNLQFSNGFLNLISNINWPGEIRQLKKAIRFLVTTVEGDQIFPHHLHSFMNPDESGLNFSNPTNGVSLIKSPAPSLTVEDLLGGKPLRQIEEIVIQHALRRNDGHRTNTAEELGISIRTLRNKIKEYGGGL